MIATLTAALTILGATQPAMASPAVSPILKTITITPPTGSRTGLVSTAVDADNGRGYVADLLGGTVRVIDLETREVSATIPHGVTGIGDGPSDVEVDHDHHQAYVANQDSDTVSVIDTNTTAVTAVIGYDPAHGIGRRPSAVAVDPGVGRAYVANARDNTVSVIDTSTNSVATVIAFDPTKGIGYSPLDIAVDTVLHRAYVVNAGNSTVSVIDTTTDTVMTVLPNDERIAIGHTPLRIAVDSQSHRGFVTNNSAGTVSVIDTAANSVIAVLPNDAAHGSPDAPVGVGVDTENRQVYVYGFDQISVINLMTLSVIRVIPNTGSSAFGDGVPSITMDTVRHQALLTGSKTVAFVDLDATAPLLRRGGADRFEVSAANSAAEFPVGVDVAYVASGGAFADALSGSAAAGFQGAPVLLVSGDSIPGAIGAELARLKPKRIVILGGTASVSESVKRALGGFSPIVDRLAGADRYAVSAAISRESFAPGIPVAYLASGAVFPDALSGSAVAAHRGGPVLLTTQDALPQATVDELARLRPGRIVILGGLNTISAAVESQVKTAAPTTRIGGADRFEVSAAASASAFPSADVVYVASGTVFPDALSGSPAAAANGAPVLLVTRDAIPASVAAELARLKPARIVVLGGTNTVGADVYERLRGYLR